MEAKNVLMFFDGCYRAF